ncbi:Alpha/Beta hydrolase protein [Bombardia bombarda]|uniref:Alpha/Beta hydrolase protein n=1 Tax=Bombardia bombarda TaxID=252184 RepID=A0AA39X6U3_9PEZI|nr:Alpha/Beta hydrolase protein [Bombardia bombarda]
MAPIACECSDVSFKVAAAAQNTVFTNPPDPQNKTAIIDFFNASFSPPGVATNGTQAVSGVYTINGVYCKPRVSCLKQQTLQILIHGLGYNKTMWSGSGEGDQYSWQKPANAKGYHTLAIDRLSHGSNPQHPDPLTVVQGQLHVEIAHQIISAIRSNARNNPLGQGFSKIVVVGHSYGSGTGALLAALHPTDIDALILTGYSSAINPGTFTYLPASTVFPQRFSSLAPGYLTWALASEHEAAFFAGAYDKAVALRDFQGTDTAALGELVEPTFFVGAVATAYTKPVLIVTGELDALGCTTPIAACEARLAVIKEWKFPNASNFEYYIPKQTGHDFWLHYSNPTTVKKVHEYLGRFF